MKLMNIELIYHEDFYNYESIKTQIDIHNKKIDKNENIYTIIVIAIIAICLFILKDKYRFLALTILPISSILCPFICGRFYKSDDMFELSNLLNDRQIVSLDTITCVLKVADSSNEVDEIDLIDYKFSLAEKVDLKDKAIIDLNRRKILIPMK